MVLDTNWGGVVRCWALITKTVYETSGTLWFVYISVAIIPSIISENLMQLFVLFQFMLSVGENDFCIKSWNCLE